MDADCAPRGALLGGNIADCKRYSPCYAVDERGAVMSLVVPTVVEDDFRRTSPDYLCIPEPPIGIWDRRRNLLLSGVAVHPN